MAEPALAKKGAHPENTLSIFRTIRLSHGTAVATMNSNSGLGCGGRDARAASMSSLALIHGLPIPSVDADFLPQMHRTWLAYSVKSAARKPPFG